MMQSTLGSKKMTYILHWNQFLCRRNAFNADDSSSLSQKYKPMQEGWFKNLDHNERNHKSIMKCKYI